MMHHQSPIPWSKLFPIPFGLLLMLAIGCATVDHPPADLASSQMRVPGHFAAADPHTQIDLSPADNWISSFDDPALRKLTREAMAHNPDLRRAAADWSEAQARLRVARSYLEPTIDVVGGASRSKSSFNGNEAVTSTRYSIEAQASWEVDLWGRIRSSTLAARESAQAVGLDYAAARQSLAASVADAWFLTIQAREKLAIDLDLLESEQRTADVTSDKVDTGVGTQLEAELTAANVSLAESSVTADRAAIAELTKALEALLGRYPSDELKVTQTLPGFPGEIAVGVPSELLGRRPDIAAADHRIAAAFYRIETSKAARLPSLTLTGSLGAILDPTDEIWSIGANLLAPIFNGGRLDAEVEIATAQQEQALADYVRVAIDAFREVETALANERYLAQRQHELQQASERLRRASAVGEDRYNAGILSIVDLMTIRRQDFQSRIDLLRVRTDRLRQRLTLYRALGGSFDEASSLNVPTPVPSAPTPETQDEPDAGAEDSAAPSQEQSP